MSKKKLAIIGAALFQEPAILKAKELGLETHVFAWEAGDPGEKMADFFYPISIREKEEILEKCREIGIDGIISIASDLAMVTVNYVAENMGLTGNSTAATLISTNKHEMREAFDANGDPSPKSIVADANTDLSTINMDFPLIVKPTDRSGSRGVIKVHKAEELKEAIDFAVNESFEKKAVVEEFATGDEYSVEYISCRGKHYLLAVTEKTTSGDPWFIEMSHIEPAPISDERKENIRRVCDHALDTLMLYDGAGHIELKVDENEKIKIIEIGGRMGGGFIGSDLVELSTGYDYVGNVIRIAMGEEIEEPVIRNAGTAGIKFITRKKDLLEYRERIANNPDSIVREGRDGAEGGIDSINIDDLKDEPDNIKDRIAYYIYKL
jgi:biotin carboxylase